MFVSFYVWLYVSLCSEIIVYPLDLFILTLKVFLFVCLSLCLSACLSVCLSACLSVWLGVCLSLHSSSETESTNANEITRFLFKQRFQQFFSKKHRIKKSWLIKCQGYKNLIVKATLIKPITVCNIYTIKINRYFQKITQFKITNMQ